MSIEAISLDEIQQHTQHMLVQTSTRRQSVSLETRKGIWESKDIHTRHIATSKREHRVLGFDQKSKKYQRKSCDASLQRSHFLKLAYSDIIAVIVLAVVEEKKLGDFN